MRNEDVIEIENAGRRCGVCRTGRGWRRFELVRPAGREPVVLCGGCRARFGDDPPVGRKPSSPVESVSAMAVAAGTAEPVPGETAGPTSIRIAYERRWASCPGSFSTAMAARAAGINSRRALARLRHLEHRGEVRRVGTRSSSESPPSDVAGCEEEPETVVPAAEVIAPMKTENPSPAQDIPDADDEHTAGAGRCRSPGHRTSQGHSAVPDPRRLQHVRALQDQLIWLGFDPGPVDGRYGPWTTNAVTRFQLANDLEADGVVGAVTAEALRARSPDQPTRGRIERVKALQRQLSWLGLEPGLIDGRYGPLTTGAVKRFQEAHDLIVDGVVGPATAEASRASAPERPTTDRAERVRALQQQLSALGLEPGPVDGRYGPQTTDAVKRFQQASDLEPDGIVDPRTHHALQRSVLQHQNRSWVRPSPRTRTRGSFCPCRRLASAARRRSARRSSAGDRGVARPRDRDAVARFSRTPSSASHGMRDLSVAVMAANQTRSGWAVRHLQPLRPRRAAPVRDRIAVDGEPQLGDLAARSS